MLVTSCVLLAGAAGALVCDMNEGWANMLKHHIQIAPPPPAPVRVLCMVESHVKNAWKQHAVWTTWGQHCDGFHVWTDKAVDHVPSRVIDVPGGWDGLLQKTRAVLKAVWSSELLQQYDYFFKADDDTYAIMPNLKHNIARLEQLHPGQPLFMGRRLVYGGDKGVFNSGGAGYVLNKKALALFITHMDKHKDANTPTGPEDVHVAEVLALAGVFPADTEASDGHTFFPLNPEATFIYKIGSWGKNAWFDTYQERLYGGKEQYHQRFPCCGVRCCSRYTATFHYTSKKNMFVMHNLLFACKRPIQMLHNNTFMPRGPELSAGPQLPAVVKA